MHCMLNIQEKGPEMMSFRGFLRDIKLQNWNGIFLIRLRVIYLNTMGIENGHHCFTACNKNISDLSYYGSEMTSFRGFSRDIKLQKRTMLRKIMLRGIYFNIIWIENGHHTSPASYKNLSWSVCWIYKKRGQKWRHFRDFWET